LLYFRNVRSDSAFLLDVYASISELVAFRLFSRRVCVLFASLLISLAAFFICLFFAHILLFCPYLCFYPIGRLHFTLIFEHRLGQILGSDIVWSMKQNRISIYVNGKGRMVLHQWRSGRNRASRMKQRLPEKAQKECKIG
jgi:hypothetical protein